MRLALIQAEVQKTAYANTMGFEYTLVHLKYTIPPAVILSLIYWPLFVRLDLYKISFLIIIAVVSTIPWDSYLIHQRIWTYPDYVILGPTVLGIPAEEIFFFVIQTYNTSLLYILLGKPIIKPAYLVGSLTQTHVKRNRRRGQWLLIALIFFGVYLVYLGREGTYLGLILIWAGPFALLLWSLSSEFLGNLPKVNTIVPIVLPTLYLWVVDTLALQRGTWTIESGTKLNFQLWKGLDIEEAVFFLVTNILIVFGLIAFDHALGLLEAFPKLFPPFSLPSPRLLISALLTPRSEYDETRILGIQDALTRLRRKSRSFYLASAVFSGRLRIDLVLLYSFCRSADDLVDNATSEAEAHSWVVKLLSFLDLAFPAQQPFESENPLHSSSNELLQEINEFPASCHSALLLLPRDFLPSSPLYELVAGFETDLEFSVHRKSPCGHFPINTESDLDLYSRRVAGTIGELCLELVFHHSCNNDNISDAQKQLLIRSGSHMGIALQYVNIARDIETDAAIDRVYIPKTWLAEENLQPKDVIMNPRGEKINRLRAKILDRAFAIYEEAKGAIAQLPRDVRAPMRVAIESYMEIGRVTRKRDYKVTAGKATVPKIRRIMVAWQALNEG